MQRSGTAYTLVFSAVMCIVCSIMVAGAAVLFKPKQDENAVLFQMKQVLLVSGLIKQGEEPPAAEIKKRFADNIQVHYIDLKTGDNTDGQTPAGYNPVKALGDASTSYKAPENNAGVMTLPKYAVVHQLMRNGQVEMNILQIWGQGLWSTMYGYLALDKDGNTIQGLTYYQQGETPGLGGEVDNPKWKARWPGRKAFDAEGKPVVAMRKGGAGSIEDDPHGFDALSGATITSRAVEHMLNFWLGPDGYAPYLERFHSGVR